MYGIPYPLQIHCNGLHTNVQWNFFCHNCHLWHPPVKQLWFFRSILTVVPMNVSHYLWCHYISSHYSKCHILYFHFSRGQLLLQNTMLQGFIHAEWIQWLCRQINCKSKAALCACGSSKGASCHACFPDLCVACDKMAHLIVPVVHRELPPRPVRLCGLPVNDFTQLWCHPLFTDHVAPSFICSYLDNYQIYFFQMYFIQGTNDFVII